MTDIKCNNVLLAQHWFLLSGINHIDYVFSN